MTDDRLSSDGGETAAPIDVQRAGSTPPDPPTADGIERVLPDLLGDAQSVTTAYLIRAGLADGSGRSVGERLVGALEDKVTVVGSTLDAGFDPANPELDVLVETDHDHGAIASTLASVAPVNGVVVADVTAAAERELEDGADEVDAADANDVFNELKDEVGQEGYGTVVDELEDVSFPGGPDPDEEIDLEAEVGVELSDDAPESLDLEGDDDGLDLDDDETLDLDDEDDEMTTKQMLGEEERDDATEVKAPDEKAIEEAIEDVELDDGGPDDPSEDPPDVEVPDVSAEPVGSSGVESPGSDGAAGAEADGTDGGVQDPADMENAPTDGDAKDTPGSRDAPADGGVEDSAGAPDAPADGGDPGTSRDEQASPAPGAVGEMDAFVGQLVDALESGAIDEERRTELREALGIETTHSLDVRLEYLQKRVDNLAAYTDAWEAFLSEQGSGREFMASVRDDLSAVEERLDAVEGGSGGDLGEVTARLDDLEQRLSEHADRHDDDVSRLDTRMDSVESKLAQRVDTIEDGLEALTEKVSTLLQWREHVDDGLGDDGR